LGLQCFSPGWEVWIGVEPGRIRLEQDGLQYEEEETEQEEPDGKRIEEGREGQIGVADNTPSRVLYQAAESSRLIILEASLDTVFHSTLSQRGCVTTRATCFMLAIGGNCCIAFLYADYHSTYEANGSISLVYLSTEIVSKAFILPFSKRYRHKPYFATFTLALSSSLSYSGGASPLSAMLAIGLPPSSFFVSIATLGSVPSPRRSIGISAS
jgi:hypothetical protein